MGLRRVLFARAWSLKEVHQSPQLHRRTYTHLGLEVCFQLGYVCRERSEFSVEGPPYWDKEPYRVKPRRTGRSNALDASSDAIGVRSAKAEHRRHKDAYSSMRAPKSAPGVMYTRPSSWREWSWVSTLLASSSSAWNFA